MKTKRYLFRLLAVSLCMSIALGAVSCKTHKDCRGRKKTAKTAMGGWL